MLNYLKNKSQNVRGNSTFSASEETIAGVPQVWFGPGNLTFQYIFK